MNNQVMLLSLLLVLVSSIVGAIVPSDGRIFSWRQSHSEDSGVHNVEGVRSIYNRFLSAARSIRGGESHGKVIELVNIDMFNQILEDSANANKLIVLDFSATWCGPCRAIAPAYAMLSESEEFGNALYLKADVDALPDLAERYKVMSMPTFLFLKNGEELERFSGASLPKLQETISKLI